MVFGLFGIFLEYFRIFHDVDGIFWDIFRILKNFWGFLGIFSAILMKFFGIPFEIIWNIIGIFPILEYF